MFSTLLTTLLALSAITTAQPRRRAPYVTAADIILIDINTSTCANQPSIAVGECRTAAEAAHSIAFSFVNFDIPSFGEQAALLSLMLYESDGFKYDKNHYPGRPGQGTRNMMMPDYVSKYAQWLSTVCTSCLISPSAVTAAQKGGPAAVLDLVNNDQWSFSSAAWYLSTHCSSSVRTGLKAQTEAGWNAYLTECVQTTATDDRTAIWRKAIALKSW